MNNIITVNEYRALKKGLRISHKQYEAIRNMEYYILKKGYNFKKEIPFSQIILGCKRKFRADYLLKKNSEKIIIEINGGQYINGRHNRGGAGYENDLTKSNIANFQNIKYYQFTYEMLYRRDYETYL